MSTGWTSSVTESRIRWLGAGAFVLAGLLALSFFASGTYVSNPILGFDGWLVVGTFKLTAGVLLLLDGTPRPLSEHLDPVLGWASLWWYISAIQVNGFLTSGEITDLLFGVSLAVAVGITVFYRDRFLPIREHTKGKYGPATYLAIVLAVFLTVLEFDLLS